MDKYSIGCMGSNADNNIGYMGSSMDNSCQSIAGNNKGRNIDYNMGSSSNYYYMDSLMDSLQNKLDTSASAFVLLLQINMPKGSALLGLQTT